MRFAEVIFLEVDDVTAIHEAVIARHGGTLGIRDAGLLEAAIMAPRTGYYVSVAELAAALCHGLAKNHAFLDGNKRVAVASMGAFLGVNGYPLGRLDADRWEAIALGVAEGTISRSELAALLATEMGDAGELEE